VEICLFIKEIVMDGLSLNVDILITVLKLFVFVYECVGGWGSEAHRSLHAPGILTPSKIELHV
jgi:hypothetical protein